MRTTLFLDDNLLLAAKSIAQAKSRTLGEIISELALKGLKLLTRVDHKKGFPVFHVTSDAQPITLDHVKKWEDEE